MGGIRDFVKDNMPRMMDYLATVSTPKPSMYSSFRFEDRDDRYVLNNLTQHKATLPILERESVPASPHYIDSAREMAIITSAVIRHSRDVSNKTRPRRLDDAALERLCTACFEVEEEALQRVNELATRLAQERRRASASAAWVRNSAPLSTTQSFTSIPASVSRPKTSLPSTRSVSTTTFELVPQSVARPTPDQPGLSSTSPVGSSYSERVEPLATNIRDSGVPKWQLPELPVPGVSDDGAKRKKSFMRGIFGGESKSTSRPRH